MQLTQIALSPDGAYIYAIDVHGRLWFARTRVEGFDGGAMDPRPQWIPIELPPA
jgi:hypothetical protein